MPRDALKPQGIPAGKRYRARNSLKGLRKGGGNVIQERIFSFSRIKLYPDQMKASYTEENKPQNLAF